MSILKIKTDGDPFPAKAGTNLVNDGTTRLFNDGTSIQDQDNTFGGPVEYNISYKGGRGGRISNGSVILEDSNEQVVNSDELVGVAVNGVPIYSPTSDSLLDWVDGTVTSFAGNGWTWNLSGIGSAYAFDPCGGKPEGLTNEYRYRNGKFILNGFESNGEFTASSEYFRSNPFGGSSVTRHGAVEYDGVTFTAGHSKIIGWALDGFPIYGPYGFENPTDPTSAIEIMRSAYSFTAPVGEESNRPSYVDYPQGAFKEDYEFRQDNSFATLDRFNGRYCITPDFMQGTYAYFLTFSDGSTSALSPSLPSTPAYPYIVGESTREQRSR